METQKKRQGNFREFLENRLINPMTLVLIIAFMARSSETWSFGLLKIASLPHPLPLVINVATGIAIAFSMETLTVAALSVALNRWYRMKDIELDATMRARDKRTLISKLALQSRVFACFGVFGAICSTIAIVVYAISNAAAADHASQLIDAMIALAMQVCLIYFGVFHERESGDPTKEHVGLAIAQIGEMARVLGQKIARGEHSDADVRTFQRMIPIEMRKTLDPLIHGVEGVELWDVKRIAAFLLNDPGADEKAVDAMQRRVRRKLALSASDGAYGITSGRKGKGYEVPVSSLFLLFANEIEAMTSRKPRPDRPVRPSDTERTSPTDELAVQLTRMARTSDTERTSREKIPSDCDVVSL